MANNYDRYAGEITRCCLRRRETLSTVKATPGLESNHCATSSSNDEITGRYVTDDILRRKDVSNRGMDRKDGCSMETSTSDRPTLLLGWSPKQTDVLSGQPTNIIAGQPTPLYVPGKSEQITIDAGICSMFKRLKIDIDGLEGMSCSRVVNCLTYCFDCWDAKIIVNGKMTTPTRFLQNIPSLAAFPAKEIGPVKFLGGPPNSERRLQRGSFLTLLLDQILQSFIAGDGKYQRFLNVKI